jgi:uncharacterized protein Veg
MINNINSYPGSNINNTSKSNICHSCQKSVEKISKCAKCRIASYCSRECQIKDWKNHKIICNDLGKQKVETAKESMENLVPMIKEKGNAFAEISIQTKKEDLRARLREEIFLKSTKSRKRTQKDYSNLVQILNKELEVKKELKKGKKILNQMDAKLDKLNKSLEIVCNLKEHLPVKERIQLMQSLEEELDQVKLRKENS